MKLKNGQFLVIFEVKIGHFRGSFLTRKIQLSVIKMKFLLIIAQNKAGDVLYRSPTRKRGENIAFHAIFCWTWIKFRVHVKEPVNLQGWVSFGVEPALSVLEEEWSMEASPVPQTYLDMSLPIFRINFKKMANSSSRTNVLKLKICRYSH